MTEPIFAKIIRGEIPCHRVYEDDDVFAFLDIGPLARGHTLLVPKRPAERLESLDDDSAAALGRALPRLVRAIAAATGTADCNVLVNNGADAGQEVMHVHFHIIPKPPGGGLVKTWTPGEAEDAAGLATAISERLAQA